MNTNLWRRAAALSFGLILSTAASAQATRTISGTAVGNSVVITVENAGKVTSVDVTVSAYPGFSVTVRVPVEDGSGRLEWLVPLEWGVVRNVKLNDVDGLGGEVTVRMTSR